jgi:hypothetical protein
MQEAAPTSPLQLLFIELRVGLARSAIQAALLLNGSGAVVVLLFLAMVVTAPAQGTRAVEVLPLKWALALFGLSMFIAGITFVNAYTPKARFPGLSAFGTVSGGSVYRLLPHSSFFTPVSALRSSRLT